MSISKLSRQHAFWMLLFLLTVVVVPAHADPISETTGRFETLLESTWVRSLGVIILILGFLAAAVDKGPHKYEIAIACICIGCALNVRSFMAAFL